MKLHEAQPSAILPSSLQRVEFIPKFLSLKSKYLIFKLASTMSSGFLLLQMSHEGSGLTFILFIGRRLTHNQLSSD